MTILRRIEALEATLLQTWDDADYKLVILEERESCEEGSTRSELKDWPADRIIVIRFVSANKITP